MGEAGGGKLQPKKNPNYISKMLLVGRIFPRWDRAFGVCLLCLRPYVRLTMFSTHQIGGKRKTRNPPWKATRFDLQNVIFTIIGKNNSWEH